jgi:hypothetical protein
MRTKFDKRPWPNGFCQPKCKWAVLQPRGLRGNQMLRHPERNWADRERCDLRDRRGDGLMLLKRRGGHHAALRVP